MLNWRPDVSLRDLHKIWTSSSLIFATLMHSVMSLLSCRASLGGSKLSWRQKFRCTCVKVVEQEGSMEGGRRRGRGGGRKSCVWTERSEWFGSVLHLSVLLTLLTFADKSWEDGALQMLCCWLLYSVIPVTWGLHNYASFMLQREHGICYFFKETQFRHHNTRYAFFFNYLL